MFSAPLKTLYDMKFYLESFKKSGWKAVLFLLYIFVIGAFITTLISWFAFRPKIVQAVDTLIDYMPEMSISEGVIEVNDNQPLVVTPEGLGGYNIVFDTGRTDTVYPTEMQEAKTLILVDSSKIYFAAQNQFEQYEMPQSITTDITRETLNSAKEPIAAWAYWVVWLLVIFSQIIRIPFLLIIAMIICAIVSKTMSVNTKSGDYFKLACYMQGPALLMMLLSFFITMPGFITGLAYLAVFVIYSQVVLNHKRFADSEAENADTEEQNNEDDFENN